MPVCGLDLLIIIIIIIIGLAPFIKEMWLKVIYNNKITKVKGFTWKRFPGSTCLGFLLWSCLSWIADLHEVCMWSLTFSRPAAKIQLDPFNLLGLCKVNKTGQFEMDTCLYERMKNLNLLLISYIKFLGSLDVF